MKTVYILVCCLLVTTACSPSLAEPTLPNELPSPPSATVATAIATSPPTPVPVTQIPTTEPPAVTSATRVFSDCPVPASQGAGHPASKLRLVYVIQGNLWLRDEGQAPVLLLGSGDVEEVLLSPDGSLIIFARQRDEHTAEVWAVNPSGEPPRRLSGEQGLPGSIDLISFSDDQQLVAFYRSADPDRELWSGLWVVYTNGTGVRRLVSLEDLRALEGGAGASSVGLIHITWIPGTHRLTYVPIIFYGPGGDAIQFYEPVHLVDAATGEQSVLFPTGEGGYITYSPDGKTMVIADPSRVRLMSVDDPSEPQTVIRYSLVSLGLEAVIPQPAWTSDSSSFLLALQPEGIEPYQFDYNSAGPITIWEVSGDGSTTRKLGEFSGAGGLFLFSPDLKRVAYYRGDHPWDLHIANVDGSEDVLYDSLQGREFHGWAPDSQHFLYGQLMYGDICGAASPLTDVADAGFVGWLDATRFLLLAGPWGDWDLYLGTIGGKSTRLVEFGASVVYDYVLIPE